MADNTVTAYNGTEVYESDIQFYLDQYIQEHQIEDMHLEPQSRWNAALLYINKYVFKGQRDKLLMPSNIYNGNLKQGNPTNNGAYNLDIINYICDIYINLCYEYGKEVSVLGFCKLTGIDDETIFSWDRNDNGLGSPGSALCKRLRKEREESLSNKLVTGAIRNPVGILGVLNRHYGWNMGQPRGTERQQVQSIEEIQRRYQAPKLFEKGEQLELPKADF